MSNFMILIRQVLTLFKKPINLLPPLLVTAIFYDIWGEKKTIFNWIHTHYIWSAFFVSCITFIWHGYKWGRKKLAQRKEALEVMGITIKQIEFSVGNELSAIKDELKTIEHTIKELKAERNKTFNELVGIVTTYQKEVYEMNQQRQLMQN